MYGVHGLLRKLGFGYTLDGDLAPTPRPGKITFDDWDLADHPLTPRRFVFDWHNFLSGCSSWNAADWNRWTDQSQKMGYSAIMVHAYGNNPMAGFRFEGVDKPVGYLSSTRIGRDWATEHVNDVRRLIGGDAFDAPVFGSTASVAGSDAHRTAAARKLMGEVFANAQRRGVDVIFAVDIDTDSANPQALITKLPAAARFNVGKKDRPFWLARPDTPAGYAYYRAPVAALLEAYPQIDTLVMWFRTQSTPLTGVKLDQLPESWQAEYNAIVAKDPAVAKYWRSVGIFAMSKVEAAFRKALHELGRDDVSLGLGSWTFGLVRAADRFMPQSVGLYPLDYGMLSGAPFIASAENCESLAAVAAHRPVYPVLWAQHDDGKYAGPPFTPPGGFYDMLARAKCSQAGFGIIHWTTRPLDLFFIGLSDSVWASSRNQSAATTCRRTARAMLGPAHEKRFGQYLYDWLTQLPMIGRETSPAFIPRALRGYDQARASHVKRMAILDELDRTRDLSAEQRKRIAYFRGYERFIMSVFENDAHYRKAMAELKANDLPAARAELAKTDVPAVIRAFADNARLLGISRGERGSIVSLNLRWYVHYLRLAQQLGTEPVRINFAPTSHDPLAQSPGRQTYYIDPAGKFWEVRGEKETGAAAWGNLGGYVKEPADDAAALDTKREVEQSGLATDTPVTLDVSTMMGGKTPAGSYILRLLFAKPPTNAKAPQVFDASVYIPGRKEPLTQRVKLDGTTVEKTFAFDQSAPGTVRIKLTPAEGKATVSGLVLARQR